MKDLMQVKYTPTGKESGTKGATQILTWVQRLNKSKKIATKTETRETWRT